MNVTMFCTTLLLYDWHLLAAPLTAGRHTDVIVNELLAKFSILVCHACYYVI